MTRRLGNTKHSDAVFNAWDRVREEVLQSHHWNGITYRMRLARLSASINITGITQANLGVLTTSAPHGFANGDQVFINQVGGMIEVNGRYFTVGNTTAGSSTFSIGEDSTLYTTYTSGGIVQKALQPLKSDFDYGFTYPLPILDNGSSPPKCIRVLELIPGFTPTPPPSTQYGFGQLPGDQSTKWSRVGNSIVTDGGITVPIRYIALIKDPTQYSPLLASALASRLAEELCIEVTQKTSLKDELGKDYEKILARARAANIVERSTSDRIEDSYITVRA